MLLQLLICSANVTPSLYCTCVLKVADYFTYLAMCFQLNRVRSGEYYNCER